MRMNDQTKIVYALEHIAHLQRSLSAFKSEVERQLHNEQIKRGTLNDN